jgi:nicotinamidase-related amidase
MTAAQMTLALERSATALLVMDLQNDIIDPEGAFGRHGAAAQVAEKGLLAQVQRAMAAAREAGIPVVHVGVVFTPALPVNMTAPLFAGVREVGALLAGSWGAAFHPAVQPRDGELVVLKQAVSALAGTELQATLRLWGVTTLVLTGVATNFVVEGTARQAVDMGFRVIILQDCCASLTAEMDDFALTVLAQLATVSEVDAFVAATQPVGAPA